MGCYNRDLVYEVMPRMTSSVTTLPAQSPDDSTEQQRGDGDGDGARFGGPSSFKISYICKNNFGND